MFMFCFVADPLYSRNIRPFHGQYHYVSYLIIYSSSDVEIGTLKEVYFNKKWISKIPACQQ